VSIDNYIHYSDLHDLQSAQEILPILSEWVQFKSVLDVGCGTGSWLKVAKDLGALDSFGIDGNLCDASHLHVDISLVKEQDLNCDFDITRKFDLVISLEVAEHLGPKSAERFIAALVRHSDLILFSAAIPHQGGQNHLNEQWTNNYWINQFKKFNYQSTDILRSRIWANKKIHWWYRQNILIFFNNQSKHVSIPVVEFHNYIHPELYLHKIEHFNEHVAIIKEKYESGELLSLQMVKIIFIKKLIRRLKYLFFSY
jgi:2-polyprenyl-3-methyl-5-hydroxy-6-metoxy-1,4-benzoquinol methylase